MKLFSILNKPAAKADNKQAGIVFLEYVIMAFIVTVAVICALWWFYWHLQQMTWEIKQKLEVLKTLNCELGKPGETQPTPASEGIYYEFPADGFFKKIPVIIPYPNQNVEICNLNPEGGLDIQGYVHFYANGAYIDFRGFGWSPDPPLAPGNCITIPFSHTNPGPWEIGVGADGDGNFSVTVTQQ